MIASQRKAHKFIWILLTVGMVIFLLLSIGRLDFAKPSKTLAKEQILATLKENKVTISVKTPLKSASSLVYELLADGKPGLLLGEVGPVGSYSFQTTKNAKGIIIIDQIKNNQLFKTTF